MENKREKFLRVFANVPEDLRRNIIAVVEGKTYTWNTAFLEIKDKTELGKKILKTIENTKII
ncbi:MAG: hypothetical protein KJ646_04595 [Nanoarchaeota archaeon]|nr:hypothetical protein [Nanoarchaeota archaeon]MBU4116505.1 hypothetical protein [Nanoarchaeota archaeon]